DMQDEVEDQFFPEPDTIAAPSLSILGGKAAQHIAGEVESADDNMPSEKIIPARIIQLDPKFTNQQNADIQKQSGKSGMGAVEQLRDRILSITAQYPIHSTPSAPAAPVETPVPVAAPMQPAAPVETPAPVAAPMQPVAPVETP